jgi:heptosyltransferase II
LNTNTGTPIKALIEIPNWLGDCVMFTPAFNNIINYYNDIEVTILGSSTSIEFIASHPKIIKTLTIDSKNKLSYKTFANLGSFDIFFSFRGSMRAKIIKFFISATNKYQYSHGKYPKVHQVEKYVNFVNDCLNTTFAPGNLSCYLTNSKNRSASRILGINPGASYGNAKRWHPEKFAKIAIELSNDFDIMIFGGKNELEFAKEIENNLTKNNISNYRNLAGKTSIAELTNYISNLDIFITGDSGPMHIAASLNIPTISLFGPTNPIETSQWNNSHSIIVKKSLDCQPCMRRKCPLKHHNCMKLIEAREVIDSISEVVKI